MAATRTNTVTAGPLSLSIYVIAYNDEPNMRACLESVAGWAAELIVVDSHSTDRTAAIAREFTDKVYQVEFTGFGALRNQAVAYCSHEWIFSLDTDERMTPELQREIEQVVGQPNAPYCAGKGGFKRGSQRRPSSELSSAVSSPQMYAPAPV